MRRAAAAMLASIVLVTLGVFPTHANTTIRMWTFLDPVKGKSARELVLKKLIENFEAANPGVSVIVEPQIWQQMSEKFLAAHQAGTAPDIPWIFTSRVYTAIKLGALANLDDLFVKNWPQAEKDDLDGPFWRLGATPTAHYQFANSVGIFGQLYRVDLFKEAGIDPKALSTWDAFNTQLQKLVKKDDSGTVVRWGFGQPNTGLTPIAPALLSILLEQNGRIFDENLRAVWATDGGVKGLQMQADMIQKYKIMSPNQINLAYEEVQEQFLAGRIAVMKCSTARWLQVVAQFGPGTIGYLPTPSFKEGTYSPSEISGWHFGVWSGSKNKELAGRLVEYMASKEADSLWTTMAGQLPNRKSTITNNPQFFGDPNNAVLLDAANDFRKNGWLAPDGAGEGGWNEGLNSAFQDVIVNNVDPREALRKAEAAFNRMRRR